MGVLIHLKHFFGGLMKKSFLYFIPAALMLAMLFAGCPQEADDDDNSGRQVIPSYQTSVDGIAVAFADGAPVVYLKDNLHLGDDELVIPAGRTLDLRENVTIDQIGANGKLVVVGEILPTEGENREKYNILLYKAPTAKIIITEDRYNAYVDDVYEESADGSVYVPAGATETPAKFIKALPNQVIKFATFDIGSAEQWEAYITAQTGPNSEYVPLLVGNGTVINTAIAKVISTYGSGRKVYIIGDVTITGDINLTDAPLAQSSISQFNQLGEDQPGSLLIGGAVTFEGDTGQVSTDGGLTVLGTVTTSGRRQAAYVNAAGEFVTYVLRLESGGGSFGGSVRLIGSLPSKFGAEAIFYDTVEALGPVIIGGAEFKKEANFYGTVEFIGAENSISGTGKVTLHNNVILSNGEPVDLSDKNKFEFGTSFPGFTYNDNIIIRNKNVNYSFPVIFNGEVSVGTDSYFEKGVTFNNEVKFAFSPSDTDGKVHLGTSKKGKTSFARAITIPANKLAGGSIGVPVTFNKTVTFVGTTDDGTTFADTVDIIEDINFEDGAAIFGGTVSVGGNAAFPDDEATFSGSVAVGGNATFSGKLVTFNNFTNIEGALVLDGVAGSFSENAAIGESLSFAADKTVTIAANKRLNFAGGQVVLGNDDKYGVITPSYDSAKEEGAIVKLENGALSIEGGVLYLDSASVDISGGGRILIGVSNNNPVGIEFSNNEAAIVSSGYKINGGSASYLLGMQTVANSAKAVTLGPSKISGDDSAYQATLVFYGNSANLKVSDDIEIDGVTLDFATYGGGSVSVIKPTLKTDNPNPVITLKGGNFAAGAGTIYSGKAGGIRLGDSPLSPAIFGAHQAGTLYARSVTSPDGYIVGNNGKLVAGSSSGTIDAISGIPRGYLGATEENATLLITASGGFAVYYETVPNAADAIAIVKSTGQSKRFFESNVDVTSGNIAVFAAQ
jgi:hypothetical protein